MKNQRGAVSAVLLILLAFLGTGVVLLIGVAMWIMSIDNTYNPVETSIKTEYNYAISSNSQYTLRILTMAQVPEMQKNDMKELITAAMQGRYGADGSKAVFQMLKEQNPNLDPALYSNIQKEIVGGTKDFDKIMRTLEDKKQSAINLLNRKPTGWILQNILGYPELHFGYKGDTDDYPVIKSVQSKETFETGIDKGLKLR